MSLIDTLAPLILAIAFSLILVAVVGAWAIRFVSGTRSQMLAQKRNLQLERQAFRFVETLFIESNSASSEVSLSPELTDELWDLHNKVYQNKELTR